MENLFFHLLIVLFVTLFLVRSDVGGQENRTEEGEESLSGTLAQYHHPWRVSLQFLQDIKEEWDNRRKKTLKLYRTLCSGTILNPYWILTAAHCLKRQLTSSPKSKIRVAFGSKTLNENWEEWDEADWTKEHFRSVKLTDCHYHPEYERGINDIGLVRVSFPIELDGIYAKAALLPERNSLLELGEQLNMAAWGFMHQWLVTNSLLETNLTVVEDSKCSSAYHMGDVATRICATKYGTGMCTRDSGAGLTKRVGNEIIVFGVASGSIGECFWGREMKTVFMRVTHYLDWIYSTMKITPEDNQTVKSRGLDSIILTVLLLLVIFCVCGFLFAFYRRNNQD